MNQLSIIIRELTDELNNVVKEIEICENNDEYSTLLFKAGVILENIKKLIKGKPVTRYDIDKKQSYLFYPDGTRQYNQETS